MTAPSHGGGEGEEAELLCHQERPFWFQEALAPSWGQDAGGRGRAFLQSEPFPMLFLRLAGGQGRGSYFALLVLSSVGVAT